MACGDCKAPVSAGELRVPVVIERLVLTDDTTGGQAKSWVNVGVLWCKVEQTSGREDFEDEQLKEVGDHIFWARWGDVVAYNLRSEDKLKVTGLIIGNPPFNVRSVQNVDLKSVWAKVLAERGVLS